MTRFGFLEVASTAVSSAKRNSVVPGVRGMSLV